ncbi:vacuolar membrane protein [Rhodotorula toruloides]|uniref:Vacuolar membrane protein n=1 Tax=Rhodotorula toruloides TaxID=5286 RepID=A0A511KHS1_RHOTO|nr:vacuolar membrane protein [Rhodotorula toruloides]
MEDLVSTLADTIPASNGSSIAAPILEELGNEVDLATCRLLGPFALVIQGIMGAVVILSLLAKRMREKPRRKWKIWLGDVSKQVVGQAFVHSANIAISDLIALHTSDNPCSLYALNILVDTTLGVLILYYLLRLSTHLMHTTFNQPAYETGFYGSPFSLSLWGEQAAIYVACLTAMKIVVLVLFWAFPVLEDVMSWMLGWVTDEEAQVFIVMLVLPLVMNLFQFLMVDSILKSKDGARSDAFDARLEETDEEALRRGFLDSHDDDEEESDHDGAGRGAAAGYSDQSPKVGRGSVQPNGQRSDAMGARGAEHGLLDAEEEASHGADGPFFALSMPAQHAYPPAARPTSSAASTTLPPYSAHPAPPASSAIRQSLDEEDDWSAEWDQASASDSASNADGGRRESIPLAPVKAAAPHPPQPARVGHARMTSEDVGEADEWGFDADANEVEEEEANAPGNSTPPVPSTPTPRQSPPAPALPSLSPALESSVPVDVAHEEADDWGIDEHAHVTRDASTASDQSPPLPPPAPAPAPEPLPSPLLPAVASPALSPAPETSPSPPPSPPAPPPPAPPVEPAATLRQSVDGADDWGFDADADAQSELGTAASEPAPEVQDEERIPQPEPRPRVQSNGHAGAPEEDEDDWGFDGLGLPPPPPPPSHHNESSHAQSASISSALEKEVVEPSSVVKGSVAVVEEATTDVGRRPAAEAEGGEEADDDWGFDDSPSLTISALDPNVRDVVAELEARKNGASVREKEKEEEEEEEEEEESLI